MTFELKDIYKYLSPFETMIDTPSARDDLVPKDMGSFLAKEVLNPTGRYLSTDAIESAVKAYYTKTDADDRAAQKYFVLTQKGAGDGHPVTFGRGKGNSDFWSDIPWYASTDPGFTVQAGQTKFKERTADKKISVKRFSDFIQDYHLPDDFVLTAFSTRDAYVSPAVRGASDISFFLNYTPALAFSQLTPYLDVSFELRDPAPEAKAVAPRGSQMRFLLGAQSEFYSKGDIALAESGQVSRTESTSTSYFGMESFLSPQTMVDVESINSRLHRTSKPIPFVPFASIESFDIKIQNAGAGKFASKRGTLKFRIHDRSRLSEFSDFIRGPTGFRTAFIHTTYGWCAPRGRNDVVSDSYAEFVNRSMLTRDVWRVMNTQVSFDQAGQIIFSLDIFCEPAARLQVATITDPGDKGEKIRVAMETLVRLKSKYLGEDGFTGDIMATQVFNAATTTGHFSDIKDTDVKTVLMRIQSAISSTGMMTDDDSKALKNALGEIGLPPGSATQTSYPNETTGGPIRKFGYDQIPEQSLAHAEIFFKNRINSHVDPYLPDDNRAANYFKNQELNTIIKGVDYQFQKLSADKSANKDRRPLEPGHVPPVVSFGKLFLSVVAPVFTTEVPRKCDELQVFFYALNDKCGPISGHSLAEFPIHMESLMFAYSERIKQVNTTTMSLQEFLGLVVESQFNEVRAVGYGQTTLYKPYDFSKPKEVLPATNASLTQAGLNEWYAKYKQLKMPVVEMYVEAGVEGSDPGDVLTDIISDGKRGPYGGTASSGRMIYRIHVYDKQNSPYKLAQSLFTNDSGARQVGQLNEDEILDSMRKTIEKNPAMYDKLLDDMNTGPATAKAAALGRDFNTAGITRTVTPEGDAITIPNDEYLQRRIKQQVAKGVPIIIPGTNGSLVQTLSLASKTDGAAGANNLSQAYKNTKAGKPTLSPDGMSEVTGIPLKVVPMQMQMTTAGVPTALLYQTFFIDFDTGTTIDNLYLTSQLTHNITKGKFTTQWTLAYSNGYGRFEAPPSVALIELGAARTIIAEHDAADATRAAKEAEAQRLRDIAAAKAAAKPKN